MITTAVTSPSSSSIYLPTRQILWASGKCLQVHASPWVHKPSRYVHSMLHLYIYNIILPFLLHSSPHPHKNSSSISFFPDISLLFDLNYLFTCEFFGTEFICSKLMCHALKYWGRNFWTYLPCSWTVLFTCIFSFTLHKTFQPLLLSTFLSTEHREIKQDTQDHKPRKRVNTPEYYVYWWNSEVTLLPLH